MNFVSRRYRSTQVETLKNASPATVSRAGIIYLSEVELDWEALYTAWVKTRPEDQRDILTALKEKWLGKCDPVTDSASCLNFNIMKTAPMRRSATATPSSG